MLNYNILFLYSIYKKKLWNYFLLISDFIKKFDYHCSPFVCFHLLLTRLSYFSEVTLLTLVILLVL